MLTADVRARVLQIAETIRKCDRIEVQQGVVTSTLVGIDLGLIEMVLRDASAEPPKPVNINTRASVLALADMIESGDVQISVLGGGTFWPLDPSSSAEMVKALRARPPALPAADRHRDVPEGARNAFDGLPQAGDDHLMTDPHFAEVPAAEPGFMKLGKALDKVQATRDAAVSVDPYKRHFGVDVDMAAHGMPQPTETMMKSPAFLAIWDLIMPWFIGTADNVTPFRSTGCHVRAILDAINGAGLIVTFPETATHTFVAEPSQATVDAANAERADAARDNLLVSIAGGLVYLLEEARPSSDGRDIIAEIKVAVATVTK